MESLRPVYRQIREALRNMVRPDSDFIASEALSKYLEARENLFFVKIGCADGLAKDPISTLARSRASWNGLFIEPVDFLFQRLKKNYSSDDRYTFINAAIGKIRERKSFFYVSEEAKSELGEAAPHYIDQLGSFSSEHLDKFCEGNLSKYMRQVEIETMPLGDVLAEQNVKSVSVIQIDTEGYDYEVLQGIDFKQYQPEVVFFEHWHLSTEDKQAAFELIRSHGYRHLVVDQKDVFASRLKRSFCSFLLD